MEIFHPGEKRAQALAGFTVGSAGIYPAMPQQHRDFFAGLPSFSSPPSTPAAGLSPLC